MTIVTGHQPNHFPWLGFFHKIAKANIYFVVDHVQYEKRGYQNRTRILTANGPQWLTVPTLSKEHFNLQIHDVMICNTVPWQRKYEKTLRSAYAKTPFFDEIFPRFNFIWECGWERLIALNAKIIYTLFELFGLHPRVLYSYRYAVVLNNLDKAKLLDKLAFLAGADVYLSGPSAKEYLGKKRPKAKLEFDDFIHPTYPQVSGGKQWRFVSGLSIMDALFNVGIEKTKQFVYGDDVYFGK